MFLNTDFHIYSYIFMIFFGLCTIIFSLMMKYKKNTGKRKWFYEKNYCSNLNIENVTAETNSDINFTLLVDSPTYQKYELTNTKNEEKEYLEVFIDNGEYSYIATSEEGSFEITSNEKTVTIENIVTGEKEVIAPNTALISNPRYIAGPETGGSSGWNTILSTKSNVSFQVSTASLIAGVIASICGGPITGTVTTIASYIASLTVKQGYYICYQETKIVGANVQRRDTYAWYKNSSYSSLLGYTYSNIWTIY